MTSAQEERIDNRYKTTRRVILHELCARESALLATDYPTLEGRKFIRKLHKERPALEITLVNKQSFKRDYPGDTIANDVKKVRKDIFDVLPYHYAKLVDIDLFGGLSTYAVEKIETAPHWERLYITLTKTFRHKTLKGAIPKGTDIATFMSSWCKKNGWKEPLMTQLPYRHLNKNAINGARDNRGPKYWTFLIER